MSYHAEKIQKNQKVRKLLATRIDELKEKIKHYHIKIISAKHTNERRVYERKKEWLIGILTINEMLNEQFKSPVVYHSVHN